MGEGQGCCTHRLSDPLAEDGQQEEGRDGWGKVAGDRLDVVKKLPTVGTLDDGDPEDADDYEEDYEQPVGKAQDAVSTTHRNMDRMNCAWESGRERK